MEFSSKCWPRDVCFPSLKGGTHGACDDWAQSPGYLGQCYAGILHTSENLMSPVGG